MQKAIDYLYNFLYLLLLGRRRHPEKWMLFSDLTIENANQIANQRREKINQLIQENSVPNYEFLEIPPNYETSQPERKFIESVEESHGQAARLKWQIKSTEFLLLDRLIDLILLLKADDKGFVYGYPLIKLEPLDKSERKNGLFPWKAVIEGDSIPQYYELLYNYREWIGISMELRENKFNGVKQNGSCKNSNEEGTVGGYISCDGVDYSMTCSHVLDKNCGSVIFRGNPYSDTFYYGNTIQQAPDAALIDIMSPCFPFKPGIKSSLSCVTDQVVLTAANNRILVIRVPNTDLNNTGFVVTQVGFMPTTNHGKAYRFPHITIRRNRKSYFFGLIKFPWNSFFSEGGDSGSWVIDRSTNIWYGMVIGSDDLYVTYLANSEPLLEFFKYQIGRRDFYSNYKLVNITPFIYN